MEVEQKTNGFAQKRLDWDCWNTLDDITTQQWKWNRKPMDLLKKD